MVIIVGDRYSLVEPKGSNNHTFSIACPLFKSLASRSRFSIDVGVPFSRPFLSIHSLLDGYFSTFKRLQKIGIIVKAHAIDMINLYP